MTLTLAAIRAMQQGEALYCHVVTGLRVRRRASKTTFDLVYVAKNGKRRAYKLGNWPQITLELARDAAREVLRQVAIGSDPSGERRDARGAPTIADLAAEWERRKAPPVKKPRSFKEDQYNLKNHVLPRLGKCYVCEVTNTRINQELQQIELASGTSAARHVRILLSGLFRLAEHDDLKWRYRNTNPVRDTMTFRARKRRVHIQPHQLKAVAAALEHLRPDYPYHVGAIWISLYCGTRITELVTAKRRDVTNGRLVLDVHKTDATGEPRTIYINSPALRELERLPINGRAADYLFGELGRMGDGARRSVHYVWDKARDAAGCPEIRPQDFRRTFASMAKSAGKTLDQIGELLSHGDTDTTRLYAWLTDDAAAETSEAIAQQITRLAEGARDQTPEAVADEFEFWGS